MKKIKSYLNPAVAGVLAALGSAHVALNDAVISGQEWVQIAYVGIGAAAAVLGIPNVPPGRHGKVGDGTPK